MSLALVLENGLGEPFWIYEDNQGANAFWTARGMRKDEVHSSIDRNTAILVVALKVAKRKESRPDKLLCCRNVDDEKIVWRMNPKCSNRKCQNGFTKESDGRSYDWYPCYLCNGQGHLGPSAPEVMHMCTTACEKK